MPQLTFCFSCKKYQGQPSISVNTDLPLPPSLPFFFFFSSSPPTCLHHSNPPLPSSFFDSFWPELSLRKKSYSRNQSLSTSVPGTVWLIFSDPAEVANDVAVALEPRHM